MNRFLLDIAATSMLDASLVASQALILNRLGVPFAAITAFSGASAYAVALYLNGSWSFSLSLLILIPLMVVVFSALAKPLPLDRYLLLTLAVLGVLRATASATPALGGQNGISAVSPVLPPQESYTFALLALVLFAVALLVHILIERSEFGLAVSVTRLARTDVAARAFVPTGKVILACFVVAALIAVCAGAFKGMYAGRVDPGQFRISYAVILLMATLVGGSSPLRLGLLSLVFFALPDLFSAFIGYDKSSLAFIRDMAWSVLIIALVSPRLAKRLASGSNAVRAAGAGV